MSTSDLISVSFEREIFSKITTEYISYRINDPELKENLVNLCTKKVKSLKVKEANILLKRLLMAIIVNNGEEDEEDEPADNLTFNKRSH